MIWSCQDSCRREERQNEALEDWQEWKACRFCCWSWPRLTSLPRGVKFHIALPEKYHPFKKIFFQNCGQLFDLDAYTVFSLCGHRTVSQGRFSVFGRSYSYGNLADCRRRSVSGSDDPYWDSGSLAMRRLKTWTSEAFLTRNINLYITPIVYGDIENLNVDALSIEETFTSEALMERANQKNKDVHPGPSTMSTAYRG